MPASTSLPELERALREHLAAAHHLARWLTRTQADAEDVLQGTYVSAANAAPARHPGPPPLYSDSLRV